MNRRKLIKTGITAAGALLSSPFLYSKSIENIPSYLKGYEELYAVSPRKAALKWFSDARFGLFIHYGPNALVSYMNGRVANNDWLQFRENLSVKQYEEIAKNFRAENFDAGFITDLVIEAGMKYVNITTRHHDGFCLFDSKYSGFNSVNSPCGRDLVAELANQCSKKGLGLCLYYSHGRDWRHPDAPGNEDWGGSARPAIEEVSYHYGKDHDLNRYLDFMKNQITELLTNYGPVAAIWLDGIAVPLNPKGTNTKEMFKCQELYDHIHTLQPQVLVSYKQGLIGTEDFLSPERNWKNQTDKPVEICDTLQPHQWFYNQSLDGKHKTVEEVMEMISNAKTIGASLLLNTGPLPDGSIHHEDVKTLKETGRQLKK